MLEVVRERDIVWMTLNRPPANALNNELLRLLVGQLEELNQDRTLTGLVLTGAGQRFFSPGGDFKEFGAGDVELGRERIELGSRLKSALAAQYAPVVVAVNGIAAGSGMEMAAFADFCVASTTARFGMPEINHGLLPMAKGVQQLVKVVGLKRTQQILFSGEFLDVHTAKEYGLVDLVVEPDELIEAARTWIEDMAAKPSQIFRSLKRMTVESLRLSDTELQAMTDADIVEYFANEESKSGLSDFIRQRDN